MNIALLVTTPLPEEWLASGIFSQPSVRVFTNIEECVNHTADVYVDFFPEPTEDRLRQLAALLPATVFVNAVTQTLSAIGKPFVRFNGWPGFGEQKLWELSAAADQQDAAAAAMNLLGQSYVFVGDVPGLVTPRIVAMIIAEAMIAFMEGVSSRSSIDTAMKLGTGYPYGPFEWAEKIGKQRILLLLKELEKSDPLYRMPAEIHLL